MDDRTEIGRRLKSLLNELAVEEGSHPTLVEGVFLGRTSTSSKVRVPVIYQPRIFVVGQGRKRVYLGDQVYTYDALNYLVSSVPLPAECEWEATPTEPVLIASIGVEVAMLGEMTLEMDELSPPIGPTPRGLCVTPMSEELGSAVVRLLQCLKCPVDSRLLGRQMVREVVYRVLRGEQGGALRALARHDEQFSRIARVLRFVHAEYANPLPIEELARKAGMSLAAFHHHFKLVTASPPLQYLKRVRLDNARRLMAHDGYNAGEAARAVGYESASQFSREFKRLFGASPVEEARQTRARLAIG